MKDLELWERRRDLLRAAVKDSRAIEAILLSQGKYLECERQRQTTLDTEAELMDAESEICRVAGEHGEREQFRQRDGLGTTTVDALI